MAKYKINGYEVEVDSALQGDELTKTLQQTADATRDANRSKFLNFIGAAEGADYGTIVGGKQIVTDFSKHPNVVGLQTANGSSTAAGKYQITNTTWKELAPKVGATDFTPENQDKVALALIARRGAADDVDSGDFNAAIGKLGKEWASMPSSTYGQNKRSPEWVAAHFAKAPTQLGQAPTQSEQAPAAAAPVVPAGYPEAPKKVDPATLDKNQYWVNGSKQMYAMRNGKPFDGTDAEAAQWGKEFMGYFNANMVQMTRYAHDVNTNGSNSDKQAFLYMMDTYDNTQWSWEGAGRALKGMATDPTTYIGLGTLGVGTAVEIGAATAAKAGAKKLLLTSLGRTGIVAGIEGGMYGTAQDVVKQSVEVSGGRKDSIDLLQLGASAAVGATAGVVLGTAADAGLTAISPYAKKGYEAIKSILPSKSTTKAAEAPKVGQAATPLVTPGEAAGGAPGASGAPHREYTIANAINEDGPVGVRVVRDGNGNTAVMMEGGHPVDVTEALKAGQSIEETIARSFGDHPEGSAPDVSKVTPGAPKSKAGETPADLTKRTILTEKEVFEATKRQQEGRLPIDDLPPKVPANEAAAASVTIPDGNTGLRSTPRSMEALTADGEKVAAQLRGMDDNMLHGALEAFRQGSLPLEDSRVLARGVQIHADELRIEQADIIKRLGLSSTTPEEATKLVARQAEIEARLGPLSLADDAFGSIAGSILRQRQEGLPGMNGITVESLMKDHGLTREAAEAEFVKLTEGSKLTADAQRIAGEWDEKIAKANEIGDTREVAKLTAMKHRELDGLVAQEMPQAASFSAKALEFAISNVFSATTVQINAAWAGVKSLLLPLAKYLVTNPLEKAARVELTASYSAMRSTVGGALRAARAAFRYEQSLLTRGTGRIMEGEMAITGKTGAAIRFLPRLLNATDEFLGQLNYASFVAGKAASEALLKGTEKGMTGKTLNDYIKVSSEIAMKEAYTQPTGEALIQPLVNKGVNLGYSGDALHAYVLREAARDPEALRHGSDEAALDFVRDALYKRRLSGEGMASSVAASFESGFNKVPALKLVLGQLFFRTPIRVFEEGIRLTPGVQILAPGFISDLAGKNGMGRMVRAKAESLASLGVLGSVLTLYGSGRITGDGNPDNWKQTRTQTDGPGQPPYTIRMADGSTWSYRNFDPISTPFKIIVNGLERMDKLTMRQAQGEFIGKDDWDKAQAFLHVGLGAITAAITDANLTQGIGNGIKLFQNLGDPEGKEDAWLKWFGEQMALAVPNTLHKIAKMNDPTIKDPADFWRVVEARLHFSVQDDVKSAYSYDALGNVRQLTDTGTLWNIFSTATTEERAKGMSPESQKVMLELHRIEDATGAVFAPPLKNKMTGGFDFRTTMTSDGKETLYDRWQKNYRSLEPEKALYPIVMAPMPDGTHKYTAIRRETIQTTMNRLQEAAFALTMAQEQKVVGQVVTEATNKAAAQAGQFDFRNGPK